MLILQIGDLKGFFGLLMVNVQLLRTKLKILDNTYGNGTGFLLHLLLYSSFLFSLLVS